MNRKKEASLSMYKSVNNFLAANTSNIISTGMTVITDYKSNLSGMIDAINRTLEKTEVETKGITLAKAEARSAAITSATNMAALIYAYAADMGNTALASDMNISRSKLQSLKDDEIVASLNNIGSKATELIANTPPTNNIVGNYGIIPLEVDELKTSITDYVSKTTAPRDAIIQRKTSQNELNALFNYADEILVKLDKVMSSLKEAYVEFCVGYFHARKIVGPLKRRTRIAGMVTDSITGNPIAGVIVKLMVANTAAVVSYQGTTDAEGHYFVKTPKFRLTYTVTYSCVGYKEVQITGIRVKLGKTTTRNVPMQPL